MANLLDPVTNFAVCDVSTGYDADDTAIDLASGHGAKLPAPATAGAFNVIWWNFTDYPNPKDDPNVEIVRVTARSTDALTVTRAQEGTSGSTKNTGGKTYKMMLAPTKDFRDKIEANINIDASTVKTTPVDADKFGFWDSVAGAFKHLTFANLKAVLKTYFDGIYAAVLGEDDNYVTDAEKVKLSNLSGTNTGDQTLPVKCSAAEIKTGTDDAKFATPKAIHDSYLGFKSGWKIIDATLTYSSADDPVFVASTSADMTNEISVGAKIKLVQGGSNKFFIVVAITSNSITLYGGTDYNLEDAAIATPYVSLYKCPVDFPMSPDKWTVEVLDTSLRTQATPTQNTWYNINSAESISIPIGCWNVEYFVAAGFLDASSVACELQTTLSTANNSESDTDMTCYARVGADTVNYTVNYRRKNLLLAAKTSYYLNTRTQNSGIDNIYNRGSDSKTIIRAICAYL